MVKGKGSYDTGFIEVKIRVGRGYKSSKILI